MDFVAAENPRCRAAGSVGAREKQNAGSLSGLCIAGNILDALVAAEWQRQAGN
jgi:hypothetical protein